MKPQITDARLEILELLGEYKVLTTGQIWTTIQPDKMKRHNLRDLEKLRELELVTNFPLTPGAGNASESCWRLTRRGADEISLPFNNFRRPSNDQILFKSVQLELEQQIRATGWLLTKPCHYNPERPKPAQTRQYEVLVKSLEYRATAASERASQPGAALYKLHVPPSVNDYVAAAPDAHAAIAIILCPPDAGKKFWLSRSELYAGFASRYGLVFAVFSRPPASQLAKQLSIAKLEIATLKDLAGVIHRFKPQTAS
jgi:Replication-relaxation